MRKHLKHITLLLMIGAILLAGGAVCCAEEAGWQPCCAWEPLSVAACLVLEPRRSRSLGKAVLRHERE